MIKTELETIALDCLGGGRDGGTPEPGREDPEHGKPGGGLRAAIDAAVHIVTEFAAAYRRVEQYLAERRQTLEREAN